MGKHIFWGAIVLFVAFIGGYVALASTGNPEAANDLGEFGGLLLFLAVVLAMFT